MSIDNYDTYEITEDCELQIKTIIADAVRNKITETVEALEAEKEQSKTLEEIIYTLNAIIRTHDEEMTQTILKTIKEVEKRLIGEFVPHDIVWYTDKESSHTKCTKCEGAGKAEVEVFGKMTKVGCPHCQGGNIYTNNYFPAQDIVASIYFNFCRADRDDKNSVSKLNVVDVYLEKYDHSMKFKSLFKTLEACQAECDALNLKEEEE